MEKLNIDPSQLVQLPENPTVDQAVEYMETSIDMVDWNLKRARIKRAVGNDVWCNNYIVSNDSYVARIDASGLVVKVLKGKVKVHTPFKYKSKRNGR